MAAAEPAVPVSELRAWVAEAAARTSFNQVAKEVGLTTRTVIDFVNGSNPHASSIRRYTRWFVQYLRDHGEGDLPAHAAGAAIDLLLEHLPPRKRAAVRESLLGYLHSSAREAGVSEPGWMREIRRRDSSG